NRFSTREAAARGISDIGELAIPALETAARKAKSAEIRKRAGELLEAINNRQTPNDIRRTRAVQVIEFIGNANAQDLLRKWADGAASARLTQDAQAALERLAKRQ